MPRELDRTKSYDTSYGETEHRYLQGGVWFNAQGIESGSSEGVTEVTRGKPKAEIIAPLQTVIGKMNPVASSPPEGKPGDVDYRAQLMSMKAAQVKKIFVELGGPAELSQGKGAVAKMADWLVTNPKTDAPSP